MKKNMLENRFHTNLVDASILLDRIDDELISLKIRPINLNPVNDEEDFYDAYVYPSEYEDIRYFLKQEKCIKEGQVNYGLTKRYSNDSNEDYLFVEHETGPEIITNLALLTASLTLAKSVVDLIITIIKSVNESNEKKKKGTEVGRYYEAKAISIEKRTQNETKILKIIQLPVKGDELSIDELKKMLDEL